MGYINNCIKLHREKSQKLHNIKLACFVILLCSFSLLMGCSTEQTSEIVADNSPSRRLVLFPVASPDGSFTQVSESDLGETHAVEMQYYGFSEVNISINGESLNLLDAIHDNKISPEEIIAFAKIDSRNGYCQMQYDTYYGYTHYAYCYDEFEIISVYDVFESPNGQAYHQEKITIATPGFFANSSFGCPVLEIDGKQIYLGSENWGLSFDVAGISPTSLKIICTQQDGQQIGQLQVYHFAIDKIENNGSISHCPSINDAGYKPEIYAVIHTNSSSEFTIDWTNQYGTLPPGKYNLWLYIEDVYENIHPLMKNFQDKQKHHIQFEIN